jgi:hypothetical protein
MKLMTRGIAAAAAAATVALVVTAPSAGAASAALPTKDPGTPQFTTVGGAAPLPTEATVPHWHGAFTDPTNGTTYGYNMVGTDPFHSPGSSTIPTDIIPLNISFAANAGQSLNGSDRVESTVSSPIFQKADYTSVSDSSGGPGILSPGNDGVQYEDAIMRSQFNLTGSSAYHVKLGQPTVAPSVSITVPANQGSMYQNSRGVKYGLVNITWFSAQVQRVLGAAHADPTHLPIVLTDNVMLYIGDTSNCCVIGYHGASKVTGNGGGNINGQGNQGVQTYAYAAYTTPGTFGSAYLKDIHALSHEIAEWGDDPFINNTVNPWLTPTAPQYGCTAALETGDPVVGIGFTLPGNSYDTNSASDGYWHPEDEVFLPWFARQAPNTTSQPSQTSAGGRYTFMGDLNPYQGFREPATGC